MRGLSIVGILVAVLCTKIVSLKNPAAAAKRTSISEMLVDENSVSPDSEVSTGKTVSLDSDDIAIGMGNSASSFSDSLFE